MIEFLLALAAFLASHALPRLSGARDRMIQALGGPVYMACYALLSIALLVWLISAAIRAPYIEIWPPNPITALAPILAMPVAIFLVLSGLTRPNPLSVSLLSGAPDLTDPGALALTRHPVLWGFAIWAAAHALANGDVVALILFGGMTAFSLLGMRALERRARARLSLPDWIRAVSPSAGPKTVRMKRFPTPRVWIELAVSAVLYVGLLHGHARLFGVDPLAWFS